MKKILSLLLAIASLQGISMANPKPTIKHEVELKVPLEEWVKRSVVDSAKMIEENCIHIERDSEVNLVNGLHWMPKLQGFNGILVIHPFSPKRPALVEYPISAGEVGKYIKIIARGSDHEPGGKLILRADEKILGEFDINSEWEEVVVQIPKNISKISISWNAKGWFNEMLWIDSVEVVSSMPQ